MLVGGAWGIHRSFLRSRDPRLARYIESSFRTTPPYGVHILIHLHSCVTGYEPFSQLQDSAISIAIDSIAAPDTSDRLTRTIDAAERARTTINNRPPDTDSTNSTAHGLRQSRPF
jgi:hypothetical protein